MEAILSLENKVLTAFKKIGGEKWWKYKDTLETFAHLPWDYEK